MFTALFNIMQDKQVLNLSLMRAGDKLVASFQPLASNDAGATGCNLSPLVVTALPAELDAGFIQAVTTPLRERYAMLVNLDEFKQSTKNAAPKTKTDTKSGAGSVSVIDSAPKKSKKDEKIEEAEKLFKMKNLPGAYQIYKKLYEQDKADQKIGTRMHEIWAIMSQGALFGKEPETAVVEEKQPGSVEQAGSQAAMPVTAPGAAAITGENEEEAPVDMFADFINRSRIAVEEEITPVMPVEEKPEVEAMAQPVMLPPGMTMEDYEKFLAFQQFQKQDAAAVV